MTAPSLAFEVHHVIPTEVFGDDALKEDLRSLLGEKGLQSYNNRMALFKDPQMAGYVR